MTQDELKQQVAIKALEYVHKNAIIGVGTGSTANFFIQALADIKDEITGTVASSIATQKLLQSYGIKVFELNDVENISVYIDGADEIDDSMSMIKGGGGALTREKIVASMADKFVCIVDDSKLVKTMGNFPLPVEVIPMAVNTVKRKIAKNIGGVATLRDFTTDNNNKILDISNLKITNPQDLEAKLNNIAGIVTNGLFSMRGADVVILGTQKGVKVLK